MVAKRGGKSGTIRVLYNRMRKLSQAAFADPMPWTHFIHPNGTIISYVATNK